MRYALLTVCGAAIGCFAPAAAQQQLFDPALGPQQPPAQTQPQQPPQPPQQAQPQRGPISLLPQVLAPSDEDANSDATAPGETALGEGGGEETGDAPVASALTLEDLTPDRAALEAALPGGGPEAEGVEGNPEGDPNSVAAVAPDPDIDPTTATAEGEGVVDAEAEEMEIDPDVILPYALVSTPEPRPGAVLRVLNQRAGKTEPLEVETGHTATVGTLSVRLEACVSGARPLDAAALLVIRPQNDPDAAPLFSGWMSAAAPSLSTLQHPDYDIWVARCMTES